MASLNRQGRVCVMLWPHQDDINGQIPGRHDEWGPGQSLHHVHLHVWGKELWHRILVCDPWCLCWLGQGSLRFYSCGSPTGEFLTTLGDHFTGEEVWKAYCKAPIDTKNNSNDTEIPHILKHGIKDKDVCCPSTLKLHPFLLLESVACPQDASGSLGSLL